MEGRSPPVAKQGRQVTNVEEGGFASLTTLSGCRPHLTLAFHRRQRRISQLCPCLVLPKALIKLHCRIGGGGDWRGRPEIGYDYKHHHQPFSANQDTQRFATPYIGLQSKLLFPCLAENPTKLLSNLAQSRLAPYEHFVPTRK
jgi:hypothetical protein